MRVSSWAAVAKKATSSPRPKRRWGYETGMWNPLSLSRAQGGFYVVTGLWPVVHRRSFEWVTGPKVDRWLVYTVGGLLVVIGYAQRRASTPRDWRHARRLGAGTAGTLLLVDVVNVSRRRIRPTYLLDAAVEAAILVGWAATAREDSPDHENLTA
jgi:hypothetical protein